MPPFSLPQIQDGIVYPGKLYGGGRTEFHYGSFLSTPEISEGIALGSQVEVTCHATLEGDLQHEQNEV